jgi:hypothetical protein
MQEILDNLKLIHETAIEEYEESKKRPLGLYEHKALQASWKLLDETLCGAEKAVEKQIPKEPFYYEDIPHCSKCKYNVNAGADYCRKCGQAIDWGE